MKVRNSLLCAVCISIAVILHQPLGSVGLHSQFYIVMITCSMLCPGEYLFLCALAAPLISFVLSGAPAAAFIPGIEIECAVFSAFLYFVFGLKQGKGRRNDFVIPVAVSVLAGRVSGAVLNSLIYTSGGITVTIWSTAAILRSVGDIIISSAVSTAIADMQD